MFSAQMMADGHREEVRSFLASLATEGSPLRRFWFDLLDRPQSSEGPFLIATKDDRLIGVALVIPRPVGPRYGRMVFYVSRPDEENVAYDVLLPAVDRLLRDCGIADQYISLPAETVGDDSVVSRGFVLDTRLAGFTIPTAATPRPSIPGIEVSDYDGTDRDLNAQVADLCNHALRGDGVWSPLGGAGLQEIITLPETAWLVAVDEQTGQALGAAEIVPVQSLYNLIAVKRSHWGTGLADYLVFLGLERLRAEGLDLAFTLVRPNNAASIRLHRRFGATRRQDTLIFRRPVASSA